MHSKLIAQTCGATSPVPSHVEMDDSDPNPIPGVWPEKEKEGDEVAQSNIPNPKTHVCSGGCVDPLGYSRQFLTSQLNFMIKDLTIGGGQNLVPGSLGVAATDKSACNATLRSTWRMESKQ